MTIGMADCLRKIQKERSNELHDVSRSTKVHAQGFASSVSAFCIMQFGAYLEFSQIGDYATRLRNRVDGDEDIQLQTIGKQAFVPSYQTRSGLTGYTFNWIRSFLQTHLVENIHIVLMVDLTRSMEVEINGCYSYFEALKHLRKASGVAPKKTSSQQSNKGGKSNSILDSARSGKENLNSNSRQTRASSAKGYSLLSSRNSSRMSAFDSILNEYYDPTSDIQQLLRSEGYEGLANGGNDQGSKLSSGNEQKMSTSDHSLFTCGIVGPALTRRFYFLWYDLPYCATVEGVGKGLFQVPYRENKIQINLVASPVGKYFESQIVSSEPQKAAAAAAAAVGIISTTKRISIMEKQANKRQSVRRTTFTKMSGSLRQTNSSRGLSNTTSQDAEEGAILSFELAFQNPSLLKALENNREDAKMNVSLLLDDQLPFNTFALLDRFGVFDSFSFPSSVIDEVKGLPVINKQVTQMIDEAKDLLCFVLSIGLPCDALFLQQPLYVNGGDRIACHSYQYLVYIMESLGRQLLCSKYMYDKILVGYNEAIYALDNTEFMDSKLVENNDELIQISRKLSKDVENTRKELENVGIDYTRTMHFEQELMIRDDIMSIQLELDYFEMKLNEVWYQQKKKLLTFKNQAWQSFSIIFTTKPYPKPMIDLMRAIMVMINYTPPKLAKKDDKKDGSFSIKMDDDMVARCSMSLIMKLNDFMNQLQNISPTSLTTVQANALKIMNSLLNSSNSSMLQADLHSPPARYKLYVKHLMKDEPTQFLVAVSSLNATPAPSLNNEPSGSEEPALLPQSQPQATVAAHPLYDVLRKYLILIDLYAASSEFLTNQRAVLEEKKKHLEEIQNFNVKEKENICLGLKEQLEQLMGQLTLLDSTIQKNRLKQETIEKSRIRKVELSKGLSCARSFAQSELSKISDVLRGFVHDIVIGVALFFRVGWLPDQLRQESLEIIRQEISRNYRLLAGSFSASMGYAGNANSDDDKRTGNPLILGTLLDRLQCRSWMKYSELSLCNDVPSLNSMSLLYLSPWYTFVVDPDGSALPAILESIPCSVKTSFNESVDADSGASEFVFQEEQFFECYVISAQKFSITVFETWVNSIIQAAEGASTTMGTDTLNSNLNFGNTQDLGGDQATSSSTAGSKTTGRKAQKGMFLIINDVHSGASDDLICLLSSRIVADQLNDKYLEILPRNSMNNSQNASLDGSSPLLIRLPHRFRLVMLSTIPPTISSSGESKPLPISCMQYINTMHWSVDLFSSMYVEKTPIQVSVEQSYASDHTITNRLSWNLCKALAPTNLESLLTRNQTLLLESTQLITIEKDINVMIFEWMQLEHDQTTKNFAIDGLVEQSAISLSILSREDIIQYIIKANPIRDRLQDSLSKELSLIRENLAFQSAFKEVFAMTGDFLRLCGQLLPSLAFAPYSLTSNSLTNSFFPVVVKFVKKNKAFSRFPMSLYHAWKVLKGIISIQRLSRIRYQRQVSSPGQSMKKQMQSRFSMGMGTSGSSKKYSANNEATNGNAPATTSNITSLLQQEDASRDAGLMPFIRRKALQVLHFKLLPLRTLFLREMVRYVQLHIRPGLESLLKLILILSTWAQSDPIPADEVRALFYMLLEGKGFFLNRFCYYFHVKEINLKVQGQNNNILVNPQGINGNPIPPSGSAASASGFVSRRIRSSSNSIATTGGTQDNHQETVDDDIPDEDDFDEDDPKFLDRSPSVIMSRKSSSNLAARGRTGSYRQNSNGTLERSGSTRQSNQSQRPNYYEMVLERGSGIPDGLWLNKRSRRYTAGTDANNRNDSGASSIGGGPSSSSPITVSTYATTSTASTRPKFLSIYDYGLQFYADEHTYITQRSKLLRLVVKSGDPFEVEWLKSKGLRTFSALNNQAVIALGASLKAAEDIHRARQTQIKLRSPVGKKNSMIQGGAGGKGLGLAGMLGGKGNKVLSALQQPQGTSGNAPILSGPVHAQSRKASMIANKTAAQRRKSSIHSMFADGADLSGNNGNNSANSANGKNSRRQTNRASNLLENIAVNVRQSRRVILSNTLTSKWSRRQSTAISVSHRSSSTPDHRLSSVGKQPSILPSSTGIGLGSEFTEIIYDDQAYVNLLLLECHPSLSIIFKGITAGIQRNILDFVEWKENLVYLESIDSKKLPEQELLSLLQGILPPRCQDVESNPFGIDSFGSNSSSKDANNEEGMWAKGFELTILQSWLLTEALWPGSSTNMMEVMYSLVARYLEKDGYIILHRDEEIMDEEDVMNLDNGGMNSPAGDVSRSPAVSMRKTAGGGGGGGGSGGAKNRVKRTIKVDFSSAGAPSPSSLLPSKLAKQAIAEDDDDEDDEDGDENESENDSYTGKVQDKGKDKKGSWDDEDMDENEKDDMFGANNMQQQRSSALSARNSATTSSSGQSRVRSTFFQTLDDYSAMINSSSLQDNVPIINSWSKLIHLLSLPGQQLSSYGPELQDPWSTTAISCRDHHNWEVVVLEICQEYTADVDKFVFMKELRETLFQYRKRPTYFLIPCEEGSQNAVFSQRVRDFALQAGGKQIPIVYCNNSISNSGTAAGVPASNNDTPVSSSSAITMNADRKAMKTNLQETIKMVKSAISSVHAKKAILEMIDLTAMTGSAILYSVLFPSSLSSAATVCVSYAGNATMASAYTGSANPAVGASIPAVGSNAGSSGAGSWKENCPLVISSLWNVGFEKQPQDGLALRSAVMATSGSRRQMSSNKGFAPPVAFSELSYVWLPRFFPPDITLKHINLGTAAAASTATNGTNPTSSINILKRIEESPSLPESVGILYEEMESALIWIMNSTRSILQTRITPEIQQQLRRMNKLEIRMTACILTIWQLCLYIRSRLYEEQGLPAEWSSCLNSLQLWQLSRLMLKVCEFVTSKVWYSSIHDNLFNDNSDIKTSVMLVMLQENFQHGIRSIMECFSKMELNFYRENSGMVGSQNGNGGDGTIDKDDADDGDDDHNIHGNGGGVSSSVPISQSSSNNAAMVGKSAVAGRRRTRQQQKQKPTSDNSQHAKGDDQEELLMLVSQIQHLQISLQQKKSGPNTTGTAGASQMKGKGQKHGGGGTAGANSSNSIAKLRAQKQLKKANKKLDDARLQYLQFLQRTDRFLFHNNAFFGHSVHSGDGLSHRSSLLHPSSDSKKKAMIDKETSQRFYTFLSHYVAEIIVGKQKEWKQRLRQAQLHEDGDSASLHSNDSSGDGGLVANTNNNTKRRVSMTNLANYAMNARRHSNKMNISPIFSNKNSLMSVPNKSDQQGKGTNVDHRNGRSQYRKTISSNIDIMFGSLLPRDMMVCMVDWTFDKASGVQTSTGIDRKKVLKSILKLSEFIRQGKVTLLFPKEGGEKASSSGSSSNSSNTGHIRYNTARNK